MKYFLSAFRNYAVFHGRATWREFWGFWAMLVVVLCVVLFGLYRLHVPHLRLVSHVLFAVVLLPYFAVAVRRLHDTGRSGWWAGGYLLLALASRMIDGFARSEQFGALARAELPVALVQFAYGLVMVCLLWKRGEEGPNRYGSAPTD